jgi:hypothetical protein
MKIVSKIKKEKDKILVTKILQVYELNIKK